MFRWILMLRKIFASSPARKSTKPTLFGILREKLTTRLTRPRVKLSLEALEVRLVPSASASAQTADGNAVSPLVGVMQQANQMLVTLENDVSYLEQALTQEIAQLTAYFEQQWDHFLGFTPSNPSPAPVTPAPTTQPSSGAGSGSGALTTGNSAGITSLPGKSTSPSTVTRMACRPMAARMPRSAAWCGRTPTATDCWTTASRAWRISRSILMMRRRATR